MLLQSIKLRNFRQFVDEQIDFSTDPQRNVTLVIGENGTGKTTFAQAFIWCLYGETDFADKNLLNRNVAEQLLPNNEEIVRVDLQLIHGSAHYVISRIQRYKKNFNNKISAANTELSISVKSDDGNTRYLKPQECEAEIKKILPKELSTYFFFDGERIEKMSKEIASGKKSSEFSNAVTGLTGLKATLSAMDHLSPKKGNSVIGRLNKEYKSDSNGRIKKLTEEIETRQKQIELNNTRLDEIDGQIEAARTVKENCEEEIKKYAEGQKLIAERKKCEKELDNNERLKSQFIRNICHEFNQNMTKFYSISLVKQSLELLSQSDYSGKDIPEMHTKTIEYLLKRGTCICGAPLTKGTSGYDNVVKLMDYLPPQSIGVTVGQFVRDSRTQYSSEIDLLSEIENNLAMISKQDENIASLNDELAYINEKLNGRDVHDQVNQLNKMIRNYKDNISRLEKEKNTLNQQIGVLNTEIKFRENERAQLSTLDSNNRKIERIKAYALQIYNDLSETYKQREKEIREELQTSINEIFKKIYDGGLSLSIDEKYNISVYVSDFDGGVETSTAQSIAVVFAFITAIIKMARENQESQGDESYSEPYPLVMDAPLSTFDKRRIKAICTAIPETAEQVIIFIKDTDGEIAEEYLGSRVKTKHYFEKIDEFNTKLI